MRIFIGGQPKTGNVWARKLFSHLYKLEDLNEGFGDVPEGVPGFLRFVQEGHFSDNTVLHSHLFPKPELLEAFQDLGVHLISIVRNPYDTFVSFYFYVNRLPQRFSDKPAGVLIGKDIDHPDVLEFIRTRYRVHLNLAARWIECGKAVIIRYEDLHARPVETIRTAANGVRPLDDDAIVLAVDECKAENLRARGGWMKGHVRSATVGNWQEHLGSVHIETFRRSSSHLIRRLGYEVLEAA